MNLRNRQSIRLEGYDYSKAGIYFITICVKDREPLLGRVEEGKMILNDIGLKVNDYWIITEKIRSNIKLHEYIIMPNHVHFIVEICRGELNSPDNTYKHFIYTRTYLLPI